MIKLEKALALVAGAMIMCSFISGCVDAPAQEQKNVQETTQPVPAKAPAIQKTPLQQAEEEINKRGFNCKITATTFGMSQDGFLAIDESGEKRIMVVDFKNNVIASAAPRDTLTKFAEWAQEKYQPPLIVNFLIFDAVHDADEEAGVWQGKNHFFPIYGLYKVEDGKIVPGMLTTGHGANPRHYQGFLQEQRNVDLMNMFLVQAIPLLNEAQKNGTSI